jgi:protein-tyrosine phosphatase
MVERFQSWPRYREHLAAMPAQVYAVEAGPMLHVLDTMRHEFGSARGWARRRGVPEVLLDRMVRELVANGAA